MTRIAVAIGILSMAATAVVAQTSLPPGSPGERAEPTTSRIVVKFRDPRSKALSTTSASGQPSAKSGPRASAQALAARARIGLSLLRETGAGAVIYQLERAVPMSEARIAAARMALDPSVERAEPDPRVRAHAAPPDDSLLSGTWPLFESTFRAGGADFVRAWDVVNPQAPRITVAVLDTRTLPHPDLVGHLLDGYDFIAELATAGDGDGRDVDATDAGDYCAGADSSWHGLGTASIIAATANNGQGIPGAAGNHVDVLPVRVLGRCGGYISDIADGMMWAAGIAVAGVPANPTPARVINLSLGGAGACPGFVQEVVDEVLARNVVVVASSGNQGLASIGAPANCVGVISVGAHTASGDLAGYSNHSTALTLTAPGGGACKLHSGDRCNPTLVHVLGNRGTTSPTTFTEVGAAGTSVAAPFVSAAAALMLTAKSDLTPAQVESVLRTTARGHPSDSYCGQPGNAGSCGAGMLDTRTAVSAVTAVTASIVRPGNIVSGNASVTLIASVGNGWPPYTYSWRQVAGEAVALSNTRLPQLSFVAPSTRRNSPGGLLFELTVTSSGLGGAAIATAQLDVNNRPVIEPLPSQVATAGTPFTRTLEVADDDGDPLTLALLSGPAGATMAGSTLTWPSPTPGTHGFTVEAWDGVQSSQAMFTVLVVSPSTPGGTNPDTGAPSSGGGGGGAVGLEWLLALMLAIVALRRQAVDR